MSITVIGAGLAGCEAAWAIAKRKIPVVLCEMKPQKYSPAHKSPLFAELVCSNSFKSDRIATAAGLLKQEMRELGSLCMQAAQHSRVPAGGALAVDREKFSSIVTQMVRENEYIEVREGEITQVPEQGICIIATGPLTSDALARDIARITSSKYLSFFDAISPIVSADSIDMSRAFVASRYGKGDDDYINCPMNREEYDCFYNALVNAESVQLHEFDVRPKFYEGCMPVEILAKRGADTLRFGPLKPVGLVDPLSGSRPYAVVQLRRENKHGTMYNLVGFQTNLKYSEQKRVFSLIPALKNAEFLRYGEMHRNTYIDSPRLLAASLSLKKHSRIFFAGQITGVEGYMESAACGIVAGINAARYYMGKPFFKLPEYTITGALISYITDENIKDFQPMGANFGLLPPIEPKIKNKEQRYMALYNRAIQALKEMQYEYNS